MKFIIQEIMIPQHVHFDGSVDNRMSELSLGIPPPPRNK
jgi:hypothetical protein